LEKGGQPPFSNSKHPLPLGNFVIVICPTPAPKNSNINSIVTIIYSISEGCKDEYINMLQGKGISDTAFVNATSAIIGGAASPAVLIAILDFFKLTESEGQVGDVC